MNRVDKEFNKIVLETVNELLITSTESYEKVKVVLLSHSRDDVKIHDYVRKLFDFTDKHRPALISMKGEV